MLRTLLLWHLTATAVLLAVYVLVAGLQWTAARLSGLLAGARRAAARPTAVVPVARREDEAVGTPLTSAA